MVDAGVTRAVDNLSLRIREFPQARRTHSDHAEPCPISDAFDSRP